MAVFAPDLQVVFSLIEPAGDAYALPGDRLDANEWVRVFLKTGGMQHLLALLGRDGSIDPSQVLLLGVGDVISGCLITSSSSSSSSRTLNRGKV